MAFEGRFISMVKTQVKLIFLVKIHIEGYTLGPASFQFFHPGIFFIQVAFVKYALTFVLIRREFLPPLSQIF